eukprot:TRINITY_DN9167_c0_g1_i8.p1 TRINITY_DN9167_c0_g1~~TRINITY_DN9167_c0_g1_i8.p1  ORF type:complete len:150 (+),score=31.33 TRINITY_DN9167_c0_g1_i8:61-450(+)
MDHGHNHGHHDHHGQCCKDDSLGELYSLWRHIDLTNVHCLNEAVPGSVKKIFKTWDKRLDRKDYVESDCDEELLINIPFTGIVKLKSLCMIGGGDGSSPAKLKLCVSGSIGDNCEQLCQQGKLRLRHCE